MKKAGKKKTQATTTGSKVSPETSEGQSQVKNAIVGNTNQTLGTDINTSTEPSLTICSHCNLNLPGEWIVQCDDCDSHFHYNCVGYEETTPENEPWSCPNCVGKVLSSTALSKEKSSNEQTRNTVEEIQAIYHAQSQELRRDFLNRFHVLQASYNRSPVTKSNENPTMKTRTSAENPTTRKDASTSASNVKEIEISSRDGVDSRKNSSKQQTSGRSGSAKESKSNARAVSTEVQSVTSSVQSVHSKTPSAYSKILSVPPLGSSVSTKISSRASSHRRREIELQRVQEEYELQSRIDEEKLALERKSIELKELREKKLMAEKYRAMDEIASVYSGSSVNTKTDTRKSVELNVHSKASTHSELVESWIHEQRDQNYRTETINDEIDPKTVSDTLGINISVPMNAMELDELNRRQEAIRIHKRTVKSQGDMSDPSNATFTLERTKESSWPLTSVTPAYQCHQNAPTRRTSNGRAIGTQNFSGQMHSNHQNQNFRNGHPHKQSSNNNRVSWDLNNQRPGQQSTHIAGYTEYVEPGTNQFNTIRTGEPQCFSGHRSNQFTPVHHQSNESAQLLQAQMLMSNQIASRHSMPKDLPLFYGHPQEWPQFIKRFQSTTTLCGYSDAENLERLNKCLKNKARDIVESLLVMPECVDEIIETLRDKFGRPELVAKATLAKVRSEPSIRTDKIELLSDFGYKVRNACNVIESMGLHYYLYNPELIQDIIGKLPYQIKIEWARHAHDIQANNQQINMRTIAEWLHQLSRTLNQITTLDLDSLTSDRRADKKPDNVKSGYLNLHDAKATMSEVQQERHKCISCSSSCRSVRECLKFKSLSADEKWKCVIDNNLCRKCLTKHGRKNCQDPKFRYCGVRGCELKHNSLLHNEERHSKYRADKSDSEKHDLFTYSLNDVIFQMMK